MHSNSLTPMQISETQRSFLELQIDSSYYGTVDMENLATLHADQRPLLFECGGGRALRKTDRVVCSMPLGPPLVERWNNWTGREGGNAGVPRRKGRGSGRIR